MDIMKEREDTFEKKYAIDEELRFKAYAQCNRMIGLWAADRLGKTGDAASEYAKEVVRASLECGNEESVIQKIVHDFKNTNVAINETELRNKMAQLLKESFDQIQNG